MRCPPWATRYAPIGPLTFKRRILAPTNHLPTKASIPKKPRVAGRSSGHTHPKRSKFKNIRTTVDGIAFASKKEAARWLFLKELQAKGVILDLRRQVRYGLHVQGVKIGTCIPDFEYIVANTGRQVTEDVKSFRTAKLPLFRRNKRHMMAEYSIDVREVFDPQEPVSLR